MTSSRSQYTSAGQALVAQQGNRTAAEGALVAHHDYLKARTSRLAQWVTGGLKPEALIRFALLALELMVLARVFLSFVDPAGRGPVAGFVISTTEPILAPIRKVLPAEHRTGNPPGYCVKPPSLRTRRKC
jgi:hypothetical protein